MPQGQGLFASRAGKAEVGGEAPDAGPAGWRIRPAAENPWKSIENHWKSIENPSNILENPLINDVLNPSLSFVSGFEKVVHSIRHGEIRFLSHQFETAFTPIIRSIVLVSS